MDGTYYEVDLETILESLDDEDYRAVKEHMDDEGADIMEAMEMEGLI